MKHLPMNQRVKRNRIPRPDIIVDESELMLQYYIDKTLSGLADVVHVANEKKLNKAKRARLAVFEEKMLALVVELKGRLKWTDQQ